MNLENKVIKSMVAVPVGFVVLKDSTVVNRFYNSNYPSGKDEVLKGDLQLYLNSFNKTKLSKQKRITNFIDIDMILNKLYSKTKYKDKYFFVFKEDLVSLIYIDMSLFKELSIDTIMLKDIYLDNRLEIKLITKMEI